MYNAYRNVLGGIMEKKKLLLDCDEVICFSGFLEAVNEFLEANYVIDDFSDYYIDEAVIPAEKMDEFNKFINGRNMYENAHILPGAIDAIKLLSEEYDIYILSSCVNPLDVNGSGRMFADKYNFLIQNLPFIKPGNFIFTSAKHLFKADVKIDDRMPNFEGDEVEVKILFPSYHNKDVTDEELRSKGVIRAGYDWKNGWNEVLKILLTRNSELTRKGR